MMAGIPLTMAGVADYTAKTNREAEQDEQNKLLAGLGVETDKWRTKFNTAEGVPITQGDFPYPAYGVAEGGRIGFAEGSDDEEETLRAKGLTGSIPAYALFRKKAEEGGRIGYATGGDDPQAQLMSAYKKYKAMGGKLSLKQFAPLWAKGGMAQGGRIGYAGGKKGKRPWDVLWSSILDDEWDLGHDDMESIMRHLKAAKNGGRIGADEGGLMNLGGMEKDY
jgi:hypothetical protein